MELYIVNDSNVRMTSTRVTLFGVVSDVRLRTKRKEGTRRPIPTQFRVKLCLEHGI